MPKQLTIPLGPFKEGVDNQHEAYESVFQPRGGQNGFSSPDRCIGAINVDFDDDGWWDWRVGTTNRRTGTAYKNVVSCAGLLLVQDGGSIYTVDPDDSFAEVEVVSGLNAALTVKFYEFNYEVYYTNGEVYGKILASGTATHWGLANPIIAVPGTTAGSIPAGRYLVSCTLVDANGLESGVYNSQAIAHDGAKYITVNVTSPDANATHVNVYCSTKDGKELFWNQKVEVGSLPATITDPRGVSSRPLRNQMLRSPIPGDGLASFLGYMFIWRDNFVFRSRGQVPHLFHPLTEIMTFPHDVRAIAGLQDGFYVATEKTLHWISGNRPAEWRNVQVGRSLYAAGSRVVPGRVIPRLQTEAMVALMADENGVVVGLPGGQVVHLHDDQYKPSAAPTQADIVYIERSKLRQLIVLLT